MSTEAEGVQQDELELETAEPVELETEQVAETVSDEAESNEDEDVVTIGDIAPDPEEQHAQAAPWIKDLRKTNRELQRENKELKARMEASQPKAPKLELGAKPKLEDFDYDPDKHEAALDAWYEKRTVVKEEEAKLRKLKEEEDKAWQAKLAAYGEAKSKLKVADYDEAEHTLQSQLDIPQQGILIQGAENPALLVYALGKNPAKAKELAAIKDPIKYAFALAKLETQLKVSKRSAPAPDKPITTSGGGASVSGNMDSTLERLMNEADRTGDYTKVLNYKRQLKK